MDIIYIIIIVSLSFVLLAVTTVPQQYDQQKPKEERKKPTAERITKDVQQAYQVFKTGLENGAEIEVNGKKCRMYKDNLFYCDGELLPLNIENFLNIL